MGLINKKYINSINYNSLKRVYLKVFNIEVYSVITSSLYSIVFRMLYLSIMFFFLVLIDLNNFTLVLSSIMGFNSFNFLYILKLILVYFAVYSIIILLLCNIFFFNNPNSLSKLFKLIDQFSTFFYNKFGFLFINIFFFINILGKSPTDFEKHLNYAKK